MPSRATTARAWALSQVIADDPAMHEGEHEDRGGHVVYHAPDLEIQQFALPEARYAHYQQEQQRDLAEPDVPGEIEARDQAQAPSAQGQQDRVGDQQRHGEDRHGPVEAEDHVEAEVPADRLILPARTACMVSITTATRAKLLPSVLRKGSGCRSPVTPATTRGSTRSAA